MVLLNTAAGSELSPIKCHYAIDKGVECTTPEIDIFESAFYGRAICDLEKVFVSRVTSFDCAHMIIVTQSSAINKHHVIHQHQPQTNSCNICFQNTE